MIQSILLAVVSLVGAAVGQQCQCGPISGLALVCGSDGKTYANVCELNNAQMASPTLGVKCAGACPCQNLFPPSPNACRFALSSQPFFGGHHHHGHHSSSSSSESSSEERPTRPPTNVPTTGTTGGPVPPPVPDFFAPGGSPRPFARPLLGGSRGPINLRHGGFKGKSKIRICLTNGTTVKNLVAAKCLLSSPNSPADLGIRCLGECSKCAAAPPCPVPQLGPQPLPTFATPAPGAPTTAGPATLPTPNPTSTDLPPLPDFSSNRNLWGFLKYIRTLRV